MSMVLFWSHRQELRSEVTRLLSARGHQVCPTGQAAEAWVIWSATPPPKLVIVDGQGDTAGAIDWIEQLHAERESATVVYLSGDAVPPRLGHLLGRIQMLFMSPETAPLVNLVDSLLAQQARQGDEEQGEIETELAELREHYRGNLGERLAEIERALKESRRRPTEPEPFEAARTLVHRLHGTAGSFGFPRVSAAARGLEELLEQVDVNEPGSWERVAAAIDQALSRLHDAAANPDSKG